MHYPSATEKPPQPRYGFGITLSGELDQVVEIVTEALHREGFGVLSDIDVAATMQRKLGKEMADYRVLGACNPALADQLLNLEVDAGLLLPCNVVIRALGPGSFQVEFVDPEVMLAVLQLPEAAHLARSAREKLQRVRDILAASSA
jgi:uncharacterized protein (DUF302 family)